MELIFYTLRGVAGAIVNPALMIVLVFLGIILYLKNKNLVIMQKLILGDNINTPLELTLSQIVLGILAGSIGSLILSVLGIRFWENSGIIYLFMISIVLMFIKPRFICFSYSGALLGAISIIVKLLSNFIPLLKNTNIFNIDIIYLMTFIGVLHIVEGFLVMIDGDRGSIPIFSNKNGRIIGGFSFNRYWVLSIAILMLALSNKDTSNYITTTIQTPNGWPFISGELSDKLLTLATISVMPLYAVVGYSSITFTKGKKEKVLHSGISILIYGICLAIVAQIARFGLLFKVLVIVFAPFAHEMMIKVQRNNENKYEPKFMSDEEGLVVLEVVPNGIAYNLGIKSGNKLISVNNNNVNCESDVLIILKENLYNATFTIKDSKGNIKDIPVKTTKGKRLGMILVPRAIKEKDKICVEENKFSDILNNIKEKH
ncbi:PDZ domain-containing protein [Clostridium taeniosporum]|uniref:Signal protein PDZ n=1 Tax=Clostridium taeniosporum TaxID=394958 RepID=A0A1D7XNG4_9CLOT|nr:signal protein PDZ [Clostridium taeniosporum]AOR24669.1 signal protein PDZ [Clostridium taeniosporum]